MKCYVSQAEIIAEFETTLTEKAIKEVAKDKAVFDGFVFTFIKVAKKDEKVNLVTVRAKQGFVVNETSKRKSQSLADALPEATKEYKGYVDALYRAARKAKKKLKLIRSTVKDYTQMCVVLSAQTYRGAYELDVKELAKALSKEFNLGLVKVVPSAEQQDLVFGEYQEKGIAPVYHLTNSYASIFITQNAALGAAQLDFSTFMGVTGEEDEAINALGDFKFKLIDWLNKYQASLLIR